MNLMNRRGNVAYDDLLGELELFEHELMGVDGSLAMDLMVLETKLRERFESLISQSAEEVASPVEEIPWDDDLTIEEVQALIPSDLPAFTYVQDAPAPRTLKMVCMTALLAITAAVTVFGLASTLQVALNWLSI